MFVLGFITVIALVLWGVICFITFSGWDAEKLTKDIFSWLIYGFTFIVASLASIGLYCWSRSMFRPPFGRRK